jgi:hypothetical protein
MRTARFWTGILILACLAITIILAFSTEDEDYGAVEGTVTYRGRPLTAGTIFFLADGRTLSDAVHGWIESNGHFRCVGNWRRDRETRTRFRIFVLVHDRDEPSLRRQTRPATGSDKENGRPRIVTSLNEGAGRGARMVRASMQFPAPEAPNTEPKAWRRHRFSHPDRTNLAVRLGPEPAQVDIDLSD